MGFLESLFGRSKREPSVDDMNAIMRPLGLRVCDFKDRSGLSWVFVFPVVLAVSIRLFIQPSGLQATQALFERLL
jgi:hypothetical protein